ncbi:MULTISPECIES: hypothetical protein [Corynebacterium]|nr:MULTISPECIES: hypothetical protein [Corynebacterium]MBV7280840.1 hypothetical protein [Corynebacterium sp. TAE3-ERU30]MBV7302566.1 hypothetical protein [Corynebacterium sp. TAE3-ERU2]
MGADHDPNAGIPLDPPSDPMPVVHWFQEVGPALVDATKAMLGFAAGVV